jgi:hypothetical protein
MEHPLIGIPKSEVSKALEPLEKRYVPQYLVRHIDPLVKETRWGWLRPEEKTALKEFLSVLRRTPVKVKVTPLLARAILIGLNWRNPRPLTIKRALQLGNEMALGRWRENTDGFGVCDQGLWLLNGQHRLTGVEFSGLAQTFYVYLLPESSAMVMDQHVPRTASANTGLSRGICQTARVINETALGAVMERASTFTIEEIYAAYKDSIDLALGLKLNVKGVVKAGTLAWCHGQLAGSLEEQRKLEKFIDQFSSGSMLAPTDIAYHAREYFRTLKGTIGQRETNMAAFHRLCNCCYNFLHDLKPTRLGSNEKAAEWFREQDPEKVASLRNKPLS